LKNIFNFLEQNRRFNIELQKKFYKRIVLSETETENKVVDLLYEVVTNQSKPNIDKIAKFFKFILENTAHLNTFEGFVKRVNPKYPKASFKNLFHGMKNQPSWGNKTAALFTKCIFQLHNESFPTEFKIWDDVPRLVKDDKLFLPVDRVITCIFEKLNFLEHVNFKSINRFLHDEYSNEQIEIWDDLWFWGFITQKGSGKDRIYSWNENKYWILKDSDKNPNSIEEIKEKSLCFLEILNSSSP
jgi:hypothetical protein